MAVIKGPAPQDGIELTDQVGLAESATATDDLEPPVTTFRG